MHHRLFGPCISRHTSVPNIEHSNYHKWQAKTNPPLDDGGVSQNPIHQYNQEWTVIPER
jgi:hypothetical protein